MLERGEKTTGGASQLMAVKRRADLPLRAWTGGQTGHSRRVSGLRRRRRDRLRIECDLSDAPDAAGRVAIEYQHRLAPFFTRLLVQGALLMAEFPHADHPVPAFASDLDRRIQSPNGWTGR